MKTITFELEKAKQVEDLVCAEFGCRVSKIVGYADAFEKKVVVYLLVKCFEFDKRIVGKCYQISHLYIPTVIIELEHMEKVVAGFESKINLMLKQLEYGENKKVGTMGN